MAIEQNCEANSKMTYKEKKSNFICIYRNYTNILG